MVSLRRIFFSVLAIAFLTVAYASVPVNRGPQESPASAGQTSFQDLLNSVSDASLHEVLNSVYKKYKQGVYPQIKAAMTAVHDDDAAMATSLVELARRQSINSTSASVESSATVVVMPTTATETIVQMSGSNTVVVVETLTTITPVQISTPQVSSSSPQESSSVSVRLDSSPLPGSSLLSSLVPASQANPTSQATPPSSQVTESAHGTASSIATSTPSTFATTLIRTASSTSMPQSSSSASAIPAPTTTQSSSTQQILVTTTLPNGSQSTITSFTIVPAGEQATTAGGAGSSMSGTPSLQNGAMGGSRSGGFGHLVSLAVALAFIIEIL